MDKFTLKAMAKINLGLDVLRRREDGYHEVRMIMQTVCLYDELTFEKLPEDTIRLSANLRSLPLDDHNLIVKTIQKMKEKYNITEGVAVHLHKRIPIAAGMAGGSTDAAAAFAGVNRLFNLGLSAQELQKDAVSIGADVPYCIQGGTALSEGIGEILTPLKAAPACYVIIAKPAIHVSTRFVYENLHLDRLVRHPDIDGMIRSIEASDLNGVAGRMENVLESVTAGEYPVIGQIKDYLREAGALNALMSGSGPTVFALFNDKRTAVTACEALKKERLAKQVYLTTFTCDTCMEKKYYLNRSRHRRYGN